MNQNGVRTVIRYSTGRAIPAYSRPSVGSDLGPPWYDGSLPTHFHANQPIHQWQPQLNRIFSFEPPPVSLLPNWPEIESAWPNVENIRAKLAAAKVSAEVYALTNATPPAPDMQAGEQPILSSEILNELSFAKPARLQLLVSQVSPNGGGNFEDAQGLDDKAGDTALAIVTQTGDDIIVYRRFFHGK